MHFLFSLSASALLLLAQPQFARAERAAKLLLQAEQLKIYQFQDDNSDCANSGSNTALKIKQLLGSGSIIEKDFKTLIGKSLPLIEQTGLLIFFDRLKSQNISNSAFFLRNYPGRSEPALLLDCSLINSHYLAPAIAHELVHYQFRKENIPSWFEEGVAQTLEFQRGGEHPQNSLISLSAASEFPSIFDMSRPLKSQLSYPLSFLFVRYLTDQFSSRGDSHTSSGLIAAMLNPDRKLCAGTFWEQMICQGRIYLTKTKAPPEQIRRFTAKGLLRYFALALTLNHQKFPYYQISDWMGSKSDDRDWAPKDLVLAPGQFIKFSAKNFPEHFKNPDSDVEVYRILSNKDSFEVIPHGTKSALEVENLKALRNFRKDFILVINTSLERKVTTKTHH